MAAVSQPDCPGSAEGPCHPLSRGQPHYTQAREGTGLAGEARAVTDPPDAGIEIVYEPCRALLRRSDRGLRARAASLALGS